MKKLFSTDKNYLIFVNEDKRIVRLDNFHDKTTQILDFDGNPTVEVIEKPQNISNALIWRDDDPSEFTEIMDGFYVYTTHEYVDDPDGPYGCFGIKKASGEKITEEVFYAVGEFSNGLCPVCLEDEKWGCVDGNGNLVIPYKFDEAPEFNKYGVACAGSFLIDMNGNEIEGTRLNYCGCFSEYQRYVEIALWTDEECEGLSENYGEITGLKVDIYDTKLRKRVITGAPDGKFNAEDCDAENEVLIAAVEMLPQYDEIAVEGKGIILATKGEMKTIFNYYEN